MTVDPNLQPPASARSDELAQQERLDALARLSRGIAHEFNNVLHVIHNATELLRKKLPGDDPEAAWLLDMLKRNAGRGTRLTRELLAFAGRQNLKTAAVNANRLIADMNERLHDALGSGKHLETVLGGGLWTVETDPGELEETILKLAENARDAMPGGGTVAIETANVTLDDGRDYVSIIVRDTGAGMAPETIERAFEPYFTTKEPGPLVGLGLSRVYGFARQAGGRIAIDSAPGRGTAVTLYLPRIVPAPKPENVVRISSAPRPAVARSLDGLRVLVVEDESLIGMLAEDLLEQLGCRMVGLVSSLGKAIDLAKSTEVDFALLDVDLGGEPVYPVASVLQARGIPYLFMTGYGGLDEPWRGRRIVHKPFDLDQLRNEIAAALRDPA